MLRVLSFTLQVLGSLRVTQRHSKLSFTQEMQGDSDPQPRDKDHPTSLSNSNSSQQQYSTSPVDLQSNQKDVVSVNNFTI